jgi:hypothetical protein
MIVPGGEAYFALPVNDGLGADSDPSQSDQRRGAIRPERTSKIGPMNGR